MRKRRERVKRKRKGGRIGLRREEEKIRNKKWG